MAKRPRARLAPRQSRNCINGSAPLYSGTTKFILNGRPKPAVLRLAIDDPQPAPSVPADGSHVRGRSPGGEELAIRTQVGRLTLPDFSRRGKSRAAIRIRPIPNTLFPRARGGRVLAQGQTIRARR